MYYFRVLVFFDKKCRIEARSAELHELIAESSGLTARGQPPVDLVAATPSRGLSAVMENGKELADWLGIEFLQGTAEDRPVVLELRDRLVKDLDKGLKGELRPCFNGGQGLVFCNSRRGAEKTARFLSEEMKLKIPADRPRQLYKRKLLLPLFLAL